MALGVPTRALRALVLIEVPDSSGLLIFLYN
jgi:hypothetical protein